MENQVILLVVVGTIGIMLMAFALIFFISLYKRRMLQNQLKVQEMENEHQLEMLSATLKSIEEERARIGTELHDSVGAMLSTVKLNLQLVQHEKSDEMIKEIKSGLDETIQTVRGISHEMMPIILKKYGLEEAVKELATKIKGLNVSLTQWDTIDLDEEKSLMLYRIIQESINNTIKHAQARQVKIEGRANGSSYIISIEDDGQGFPKEVLEKATGMGLWNILNRAQVISAKASFSNAESGGARLDLEFPITKV